MDRQHDEQVSLNPAQADFIHQQVESGRFPTPSDVINEAVRQMQEAERIDPAELGMTADEMREGIEEAAREIERGELLDGEKVMRELDERHRAEWDARKRKRA
jgi:antitoxin ParD1/3/4